MDARRYFPREVCDSDYDALATLHNAVDPARPVSGETLRHQAEGLLRLSENPRRIVVTDRDSGEVVGFGALFRMPYEDDPARPWIVGEVLPSREHQGIGTYLYDTLLEEAHRRGATGLRTSVRESSAAGRSFLANRSFVERRRVWRSQLDVTSADVSRLASLTRSLAEEGIELTTLSKEGKDDPVVQRKVHDLDAVTGRDVPHVGMFSPVPFEEFRRFFFEGQNSLPDAWCLAKKGDQYVGISTGGREPAQPEVLLQFYTATRPEFRRKNIALALKLMLVEFAQRSGYARITTSNDSLNVPMWTLNQRLGFRKISETIHLERVFASAPRS